MKRSGILQTATAILLLFAAVQAGAQVLAQQGQQTPAPQQQQPKPAEAPQTGTEENPKHIFGIIPNYTTTNEVPGQQHPLTSKEKYVLAWHQMFDFSAHAGNVFQAALQQASNGQPHYGQGWDAYGKRFLAAEGDQASSSLFIVGILPAVLKEDPRYFRRGTGSFGARAWYAAERTVISRRDSGSSTFNVPLVLGQLISGSISTAYYPRQDRSASGVFQNWGINLAYTSGYNVLREFYPDILRALFHRRHKTPAAPPAAPAPAQAQ
ncbi:MAG: hypothetical protein LAN84_04340 [Acidobacteriia bacterium]|nr:hypothetical protein [Terriglobia bacterium]